MESASRSAIETVLDSARLDPRIGKLNSGKYYCYPDGNGKPEFIGTLEDVEAKLGIRSAPAKQAEQQPAKPSSLKEYEVTVTPRIVTYGSHGATTESTMTVHAKTSSEAISKARAMVRDGGHSRYDAPNDYKAKVVK